MGGSYEETGSVVAEDHNQSKLFDKNSLKVSPERTCELFAGSDKADLTGEDLPVKVRNKSDIKSDLIMMENKVKLVGIRGPN